MNSTNLLTNLNVTTQLPLDAKSTVSSLSELMDYGLNNEKAFLWYKNMRVRDISTDKLYIWKPVVVGETNITPLFTYPAGHIVNNINYGNQAYSFYEEKAPEIPTPEPGTNTTYRTRVENMDYTITGEGDNYGNIWSGQSEITEGTTIFENFRFRPIASRTLKVFNPPINVGWGGSANNAVPLRIELYPADAITISPDPAENADYETIDDVINDVENDVISAPGKIILLPSTGTQISPTKPIGWNTNITIKNGATLPLLNTKLTTADLTLDLDPKASLILGNTSLAEINNNRKLAIKGGTIINNSTNNIIESASGIVNPGNVEFTGVNFELNNGGIAKLNTNASLDFENNKVNVNGNNFDFFSASGGSVNIESSKINIVSGSSFNLLNIEADSTANISGLKMDGEISSFLKFTDINSDNSEISFNSCDLSKTVVGSISNSDTPIDASNKNNIRFTNTNFNEIVSEDANIDRYNILNSNTSTTAVTSPIQSFPSRERALLSIPLRTLFINTSGDDPDTVKHFLDITL